MQSGEKDKKICEVQTDAEYPYSEFPRKDVAQREFRDDVKKKKKKKKRRKKLESVGDDA